MVAYSAVPLGMVNPVASVVAGNVGGLVTGAGHLFKGESNLPTLAKSTMMSVRNI